MEIKTASNEQIAISIYNAIQRKRIRKAKHRESDVVGCLVENKQKGRRKKVRQI